MNFINKCSIWLTGQVSGYVRADFSHYETELWNNPKPQYMCSIVSEFQEKINQFELSCNQNSSPEKS